MIEIVGTWAIVLVLMGLAAGSVGGAMFMIKHPTEKPPSAIEENGASCFVTAIGAGLLLAALLLAALV